MPAVLYASLNVGGEAQAAAKAAILAASALAAVLGLLVLWRAAPAEP